MDSMECKIIFVGGAPGVGKSTFVQYYLERKSKDKCNLAIGNVAHLRRNNLYKELAQRRDVAELEMFAKISAQRVDKLFMHYCERMPYILCDLHYAFPKEGIYTLENTYEGCLSETFIQNLINRGHKVKAVLLIAECEIAWARICKRAEGLGTGKTSFTKKDLYRQAEEEFCRWESLSSLGIQCEKYDITNGNLEDVFIMADRFYFYAQ